MTTYLTYKAGEHFPIVDDFLVEWVIETLKAKLIAGSNTMADYFIYAIVILLYVTLLYLFVFSQLKEIMPSQLVNIKFLNKFLNSDYSMFYGVGLIFATCLLALISKDAVLYVMIITGVALNAVALSKVQCKQSIRWTMLAAGSILILYSVLNFGYFKDDGNLYKFFYSFLCYSTLISIVLVLLDFYIFIPYKCSTKNISAENESF